jgi:hypothetical protein
VDARAVEISDESIQATTIDPLRTQSKSKSKSEAPLDLAALRLLRVASRVGVARWQQVVPIASFMAIITTSKRVRVTYKPEHRLYTNKNPQLTQSDREIMTAPYSICHPCPMAALALPRARALPPQGTSVPSVPPPSPLHCTSTRSSQGPVGLYLPALFQGLRSQDACTRTHEHGHAHKHTHTSNWKRSTDDTSTLVVQLHSDGKGALTCETIGAAPR